MILPKNLIRVRRTKTGIIPLFADGEKQSIAKTLIAIYKDNIDRRRTELEEGLESCEELGYDFKLVRGLSAVLESRCIFGVCSFVPPLKARTMLFEEAAKTDVISEGARVDIVAFVATKLSVKPSDLENSMYADLLDEQHLLDFKEPAPDELLQLYNFSLVTVLLAYATKMKISYIGKNEQTEKLCNLIGESNIKTSGDIEIILKPSKQIGVHGVKIEALLTNLLNMKDWHISAEILYPPRYRETRTLDLSRRSHGDLLKAETINEELIIEIKPPVKKSSFGELIIIDDLVYKLGLTDKELFKKIEAEKIKYVKLPGVLITQEKLETLRTDLEHIESNDLPDFKNILKGHGCKNAIPVLEALGYLVENDPETRKPKVTRLKPRTPS
jgi:predicted nuclease of restriction endonuclease-like RecB superfamily